MAARALAGLAVALVIWTAGSPLYNRLVAGSATAIIAAFERPAVTHFEPAGENVILNRSDFDPRSPRPEIPIADLTFNWVLLAALFATDPRPFSDRNIAGFAAASLLMAPTHVFALIAEVKAIYALRLGPWSFAHYGAISRNVWGVATHGYRLVMMFAIAFALWWALRPAPRSVPARVPRKKRRRANA